MKLLQTALLAGALAAVAHGASAAIIISEVDPYGSNGSDGYSADWFELTNTSSSAVSIAGWSMIDNHAASSTSNPYGSGQTISVGNTSDSAAALTLASGSTTLAAGQSAVFLESSANAAGSSAIIAAFESAWFGSHVPGNLVVGVYDDNGNFGLSQTADMVNIFNASSSLVASVAFGADTGTPVATFDNAAGLNNTTISTKSAVGVNGAFLSASGLEIGSPGTISAVPLPGTSLLMLSGLVGLGLVLGRRKLPALMPLA